MWRFPGRWATSDGYPSFARNAAHIHHPAAYAHPRSVGGRVTRTRRPGGNARADHDHRLTVGAARSLPMDADQQQRAVAALAALLIPLVRRNDDAVAANVLDMSGDAERSSDHADH
jgi:hypothetical protein